MDLGKYETTSSERNLAVKQDLAGDGCDVTNTRDGASSTTFRSMNANTQSGGDSSENNYEEERCRSVCTP